MVARKVYATAPAWQLIGEDGAYRLPGGHTVYEAVLYDEASARGERPRLARLDTSNGIRQINRYVDPDQLIEILNPTFEQAVRGE